MFCKCFNWRNHRSNFRWWFTLDKYKTAKLLIRNVTAPCPSFLCGAPELHLLMHSIVSGSFQASNFTRVILKCAWWLLTRRAWKHLMNSTGMQSHTAYSHVCKFIRLQRHQEIIKAVPPSRINYTRAISERPPNAFLKTTNNGGSTAPFSTLNQCLTLLDIRHFNQIQALCCNLSLLSLTI